MSTRKNLRGFQAHLQSIVNRIVRDEFPDLHDVMVSPAVFGRARETALAHWYEMLEKDRTLRWICFDLLSPEGRKYCLGATDAELTAIIRHELIHGDLKRQGIPWRDDDLSFIMECLRRKTIVNDSSIAAFEHVHGRGSLEVFRAFLPPPTVEAVCLADGGGVWLKQKMESLIEG